MKKYITFAFLVHTAVAVFYAIAAILKYDAEYRCAKLIHLG